MKVLKFVVRLRALFNNNIYMLLGTGASGPTSPTAGATTRVRRGRRKTSRCCSPSSSSWPRSGRSSSCPAPPTRVGASVSPCAKLARRREGLSFRSLTFFDVLGVPVLWLPDSHATHAINSRACEPASQPAICDGSGSRVNGAHSLLHPHNNNICTRTAAHLGSRTHAPTHARTHPRTHTRTHAHLYTPTHARTHPPTHTHTHTQTQTRAPQLSRSWARSGGWSVWGGPWPTTGARGC